MLVLRCEAAVNIVGVAERLGCTFREVVHLTHHEREVFGKNRPGVLDDCLVDAARAGAICARVGAHGFDAVVVLIGAIIYCSFDQRAPAWTCRWCWMLFHFENNDNKRLDITSGVILRGRDCTISFYIPVLVIEQLSLQAYSL